MRSRGIWIALSIIVLSLLTFGIRIWGLEVQSLQYDESLSLYRSQLALPRLALNQGPHPGMSAADAQPPLYFLLLAAFRLPAGAGDLALRFLSVAWAVLLVPLLYAAGARLWNRRVGLLAAPLGAFSPLLLWQAREARMYTMLAALGLLAVYALERALRDQRRGWLVAALLAALAVAGTHYLGLALWPVLAVQALLSGRLRRPLRLAVAVALFAISLAALLMAGQAVWRPGPAAEFASWRAALPGLLSNVVNVLGTGADLRWPAAWPIDVLCLVLFALGLLCLAPMRRQAFLAAYTITPLLALLFVALAGLRWAAQGSLALIAPAFYLGIARGLERCSSRRLWPIALAGAAAVLGAMALSAGGYLQAALQQGGRDYRSAAQAIELGERMRDVIVTASPSDMTAFLHYYRGALPAVILPPATARGEAGGSASDPTTADIAARFERIWLVETGLSEPEDRVRTWLQGNAFLAESHTYRQSDRVATLELYLSRTPRLTTTPPRQYATAVSFGSLRLDGYDLPLHPVAGGERAWVTFYWRVFGRRRVAVSLRLVDDQGRPWGRTDSVPYPAFPPEEWPIGSVMRHEASLAVPAAVPPGWYRLILRLYDPESGRPIDPVPDAEPGPLVLGPLRVDATWARGAAWRQLAGAHHLRAGGIRFGDAVALRAFRLSTAQARPGEWLNLDTYWQVVEPPGRDLVLTMELVDRHGKVKAWQRYPPISTEHPPASWRAGELLWSQHALLVPADAQPGPYRLRVSMHSAAGRAMPTRNQWLFWTWGDNAAVLAPLQVVKASRDSAPPPMEHALEAQNTAGIDLLGFGGVPERARAGQVLKFNLYWRAAAVPAGSYKVSVQLLAAGGRSILAQEDSVPGSWSRPTTDWSLGEIIDDPHRITVPVDVAEQKATLIAALYDEDTGERVQWLSGDRLQEYIVLCQVQIGG